jgi:zinc/manganese transport system substrate-binding protein
MLAPLRHTLPTRLTPLPRLRRARIAASLAAAAALVLSACGGSTPSADPNSSQPAGPIAVVAGENFWGNIIGQIGGRHVQVTSIISDPNADPHEYESDARAAASLARAKFVLENGLGYDDFMTKLLSASPSSGRRVLSVQQILSITGADANPHIWYDTARLPEVVAAVVAELARLDPADSAEFTANGQAFDASLAPILAVIAKIRTKYSATAVAYTERVPGYLVDAAGLKLGVAASFAQAIEDGNDPTPADTTAFDDAIQNKTVKVLLYNGQVTDSETDRIKQQASKAGVPIVGVTETLPGTDADFQTWQLRQATELLTALGG